MRSEKQKKTRDGNQKNCVASITENPKRTLCILSKSMDVANNRAVAIRALKEQVARQQEEINTLRGTPADLASITLELEDDGNRRHFPHECVETVDRAAKRRKTVQGGAATDDEMQEQPKVQFNVIRNNIVQLTLVLRRSSANGREVVSAGAVSRVSQGLDFVFRVKRSDGGEFDPSTQFEWKDGLKDKIVGFRGSTLQWRFHLLPLSTELYNSSLYIEVTCTTPEFEHISWTSPRFMSKARRDPSRRRSGQDELLHALVESEEDSSELSV